MIATPFIKNILIMIIVHHLNNSRSQRILWLLEELDVAYQVKHYQRDSETMLAPKSLKAIHPLGKSPIITDGNEVVAESGAIIDYLSQTYGSNKLQPPFGSRDYQQYNYWLHYAEGSLMSPLLLKLVFDKVKNNAMPFFIKPVAKIISAKVMNSFVAPNIKANLDFVEAHLAKHEWFAGDMLSGADIQMSFPLEASVAKGTVKDEYPNINAFVKRIQSRPAYQRALKIGGPYDYGKKIGSS